MVTWSLQNPLVKGIVIGFCIWLYCILYLLKWKNKRAPQLNSMISIIAFIHFSQHIFKLCNLLETAANHFYVAFVHEVSLCTTYKRQQRVMATFSDLIQKVSKWENSCLRFVPTISASCYLSYKDTKSQNKLQTGGRCAFWGRKLQKVLM